MAKAVDGVQDNYQASWYNGTRGILLAIFRQPDANTVEVIDKIKAQLPRFEQDLGAGTRISWLIDRSTSIRTAIALDSKPGKNTRKEFLDRLRTTAADKSR